MRPLSLMFAGSLLLAACGNESATPNELPDNLLESDQSFVPVQRAMDAVGSGAPDRPPQTFYLAIRKSDLGAKWFLTAFSKNFFPDNLFPGITFAGGPLGTRVVKFELQNDKLFVFDASDAYHSSDTLNPPVVLEAYPVVHLPSFERLPHSDRYLVVDPSSGLNRIGITGELFADPYFGTFHYTPMRVGLSYLQGFRTIDDGVTFEQVYEAIIDGGIFGLDGPYGPSWDAWGTLGISIRRYAVGGGYTPTAPPADGEVRYFLSDTRFVPDSGLATTADPLRWNLHQGMTPIVMTVTAGAKRAQAAFPQVDVLGAIQRGIEKWNDVLGFTAFRVEFSDEDDFYARDDVNPVTVDYPGNLFPNAYADTRSNPNNGEVHGGGIFLGGGEIEMIRAFEDPAAAAVVLAQRPSVRRLTLFGLSGQPSCMLPPPSAQAFAAARADTSLTAGEKGTRFLQHQMTHEMGHILGLRHNYRGSLLPPSSSVMDYLNPEERFQLFEPGAYDIAAVRYLYQLTTELPPQPFCNDSGQFEAPDCNQYDAGAHPLTDYFGPIYSAAADTVLDEGAPAEVLDGAGLDAILGFARASADSDEALAAAVIALGRSAVPFSDGEQATVAQVNVMAEHVLRHLWLGEDAGLISGPVSDAQVIAYGVDQAGKMLINADGVRDYPLRRTAVDVLHVMQDVGAYRALLHARDTVAAAIAAGTAADADLERDLLVRIDLALSPYFP